MTSIQTGISINDPNVKILDTSQMKKFHVSEASEEFYQNYIGAQERFLKSQHTHISNTNSPATKSYATISVNNKEVAKIYNNGSVSSSNALGAKLQRLLADENTNLTGPALAQDRAEKIAALLGGKVEESSTAITQAQFNVAPKQEAIVDYQAMQDDPAYEQLQKTKQARTLFIAQQIAQEGAANTADNNIPLEQYQIPQWMAQYKTELSSQLGEKPRIETGSASERAEYSALVQEHYQSVLNEAGIVTSEDHYKAAILDKVSSEALHQQMSTRIQADSRLLTLIDKLNIQIS